MSTGAVNNLTKGRIAVTKSRSGACDVPPGAYSCIVTEPFIATQEGWAAAGRTGPPPSGTSKCVYVIYYASKSDAYAESAYLLGKHSEDEPAVASRRRKSFNNKGILKCITVRELSACGIGNTVEGFSNVENVVLADRDKADSDTSTAARCPYTIATDEARAGVLPRAGCIRLDWRGSHGTRATDTSSSVPAINTRIT